MIGSTIDARLMASANFVRAGAVLADIGTDHGYLPIFLLKKKRIEHAYLSDINEGPLATARRNVEAEGLSDKCTLILSDGALGLSGIGITDYAICGMGGELISEIVRASSDMRREGVRLILQPMSRSSVLRVTLGSLGFAVIDEKYSASAGKNYVTILAEYTGEIYGVSPVISELGERFDHSDDREEYFLFLQNKRNSLERAIAGKERGGASAEKERIIADEINRRLSKISYSGSKL